MSAQVPQVTPPPRVDAAAIGPRCLVTGGAGYVGANLVRRLREAGCEVRSFDVIEHTPGPGVETMVGDLRDYDRLRAACDGVDTVFHTAAVIKLLEIARPSLRRFVFDVNVGGTRNIVRAAADAGVGALVHTSSFNVVLDRALTGCDETLPYATRSRDLYTASKIEAEKLLLAADADGGPRTCALRPGGIWGSDTGAMMIRSFLEEVAAGNFKVLIGNGKAVIDNTHVDNLVDAQLLAAKALRANPDVTGGQPYFITDDEPVNGLEWFRPLVEGLDQPFPTFRLPGGPMRFVGRMMEVAHLFGAPEPKLTRRGVRNLTESMSLRIDKARRELEYHPRYNRANGMPLLLPQAREFVAGLQR